MHARNGSGKSHRSGRDTRSRAWRIQRRVRNNNNNQCRARARNDACNLFSVFFCSGFLDSIFSSVYGVYSRVDKKIMHFFFFLFFLSLCSAGCGAIRSNIDHPCEASVHTNSVFIDKAVDDEQLQENWTSKTWKRCPMRGNSKRFSSKNPVFMIGETEHSSRVSNFGIIARCRSYPLALLCASSEKWNCDSIRVYRSCSQKVKRCNERRQEKKEIISFLISAFIRAFVSFHPPRRKDASRKWGKGKKLVALLRVVSRKKSKTP